MSARRPAPPPDPDDVLERSPHELIRDWPELLAAFFREGLDVPAQGAIPLGSLGRDAALRDAVRSATAWRERERR